MPNGGEHYETIGFCPACSSSNIRRRQRRHQKMHWRCRSCNKVFERPHLREAAFHGDGSNFVFAKDVYQLEAQVSRRRGRLRNKLGCSPKAFVISLFILVVIGSLLFYLNPQMVDEIKSVAANISNSIGLTPDQTPPHTATLFGPPPEDTPIPVPTVAPSEVGKQNPTSVIGVAQIGTSTSTPTLTSPPAATSSKTPTPAPAPTPTITPTPTLAPTATSTLVPTPLPPPQLRHLAEKEYMLTLINEERTKAGLSPVVLGDNIAAQLHAESSLENCTSSHWGVDGLKPYMRYSLAGGYQSNGENGHGLDYCITGKDFVAAIASLEREIRDAIAGWMTSPGHRRNILDKWHKKVNIGLAWDRYNFMAYQHFEGDYVEYENLPAFDRGILSFEGKTRNGIRFGSKIELGVQVFYDQLPHSLTRGQVSRTYCYSSGREVASLREPLTDGSYWTTNQFTKTYDPCPDPYDMPADAPGPSSAREAHRFWQRAYQASSALPPRMVTVPWVTAMEWRAAGDSFSVKADLNDVIEEHGAGVYTILVWGKSGGEDVVISEYSIFHGITPADTYSSQ